MIMKEKRGKIGKNVVLTRNKAPCFLKLHGAQSKWAHQEKCGALLEFPDAEGKFYLCTTIYF